MSLRPAGLLLVALVAAASASQAADFTFHVGVTGRNCDFATIQAAINAASADPADVTTIRIANDQTYTAQQLDIDGKNVKLVGGMATCELDPSGNSRTTLSGAGGARRSIINLRGSTRKVTLERLVLRDGDELLDNESFGGALDVTEGPHTSIFMTETQISANSAGYGGAISLRGDDPQDQARIHLAIGSNVAISSNRGSYGGGGIYCRNSRINLFGDNSSVLQNTAGGSTESGAPPSGGAYGGALYLDQCGATIASFGFVPAIWMNTASGPGGGIAAMNSRTLVNIENRNRFSPTRIAANHSDRVGGAITIEQGAQVFAYDAVIEQNSARQGGGAVALYTDSNSQLSRFRAAPGSTELSYRQACSRSAECNLVRDNEAYDGGTARHGAAFRISVETGDALVELEGARVTGNRGMSLVKRIPGDDGKARFTMNGGLVDRNAATANLFDMGEDYAVTLLSSMTFANNIVGSAMFRLNRRYNSTGFTLKRSIVHQPGVTLISVASGFVEPGRVQYVMANDLTGVPAEIGADGQALNVVADPGFTDAAEADYFPAAGSPAVDFALPEATDMTRDGGARDIDTAAAQRFGTQDLGAFERPAFVPNFSPAPPDGQVGLAYRYALVVNSGGERLLFSEDGLPPGVSLDPDSGLITGTPSTAGAFAVTLRVSNGAGTTTKAGTITIVPSGAVNGECGASADSVRTTAPTDALCAAGNATPVEGAGPWTWTCTGLDGGTSATCAAPIDNSPPRFVTYDLPDGVIGERYESEILTESFFQPVTYASFGLPQGLVLDSTSGRITGIPTEAGSYPQVEILANSEVGTRSRNFGMEIARRDPADNVFSDGFE